jgi:hypothetical protein
VHLLHNLDEFFEIRAHRAHAQDFGVPLGRTACPRRWSSRHPRRAKDLVGCA